MFGKYEEKKRRKKHAERNATTTVRSVLQNTETTKNWLGDARCDVAGGSAAAGRQAATDRRRPRGERMMVLRNQTTMPQGLVGGVLSPLSRIWAFLKRESKNLFYLEIFLCFILKL